MGNWIAGFTAACIALSGVIAAAIVTANAEDRAEAKNNSDVLARPIRRKKRAKEDRGLPPDKELFQLAAAYLKFQRKKWPDLVRRGLLPDPSDEVVTQMVEDFKARHRTGTCNPSELAPFLKLCKSLGGCYSRYSCDNSNPTSNLDQMVNVLDRARGDGCFIPWQYIFCDYSVSGLDSSRQGYSSYKALLRRTDHFIGVTYIDDFSRASRDELEWWKLAALSKQLKKGMLGASDGFNLSSEDWDIKITIYGLVSRLFIKSLRQKVTRGMKATAPRKGVLGKLPLGFTRKVMRDEHGNIVYGAKGRPRHVRCIDPITSDAVRLAFDLYVNHGYSPGRIARRFNELRVDDWNNWMDFAIDVILANPAYIGVFIWNQKYKEFDDEKKVWVAVVEEVRETSAAMVRTLLALSERLAAIEAMVSEVRDVVTSQRPPKDWYTVAEIAELLGKAEFTVREWCRLGRVYASKRACGRGTSQEWIVSHEEIQRIQNEGLLPD